MFELNQLRSFIAVATELNFRRAAQRLNMTQPPLSRRIQLLERDIGVLLFDRSGRSIRLTAAGRRFFVEAQDLLRRAEGAALSARRTKDGDEGSVTLAFIPVAALGPLPAIMSLLRDKLPNVDVVLKEMLTIDQSEALPSGLIDLGLMRPPRDRSRIQLVLLQREPYVLALQNNHPLLQKQRIEVRDLHRQDFLMYSPSLGWYGYDIINSHFLACGVRPNFLQFFGQSLPMLSMINAGVGMALVPESSKCLGFANVAFRPVDDLPPHTMVEHYLGWAQPNGDYPVVQRVRKTLIEAFDPDRVSRS